MARATAPRLTEAQRGLAASALEAARRSVWRAAPTVAALTGLGLDDVRQEACLAAALAARSFAGGSAAEFERYAIAAARNRLRHLLRAAGRACRCASIVPLAGLDEEPARDRRRGGAPGSERLRRRLRRLARSLSPAQRRALQLHLEGLNNCQAARRLGVTEATVRTTLRRAVATLRALAA